MEYVFFKMNFRPPAFQPCCMSFKVRGRFAPCVLDETPFSPSRPIPSDPRVPVAAPCAC